MTTYHNRIISAVLSIAGTVALVAFATPGPDPRTVQVAAAQPAGSVARNAG